MGRGGHSLCWAERYAKLYFCTFSARWVPFFNKISAFFPRSGYLFWRKFLYLSSKMEPICKKFSVFYFTKWVHSPPPLPWVVLIPVSMQHVKVYGYGFCCLMTPGLSKDIRCHVWPYFLWASANQQIRHEATHKVGSQPGDLHMIISIFLRALCGYIWVNILTLSPRGEHVKDASTCVSVLCRPPSIFQ